MIVKCLDCGNTFEIKKLPNESDLVACPICEADYKILFENGKARLREFVYENEDIVQLIE